MGSLDKRIEALERLYAMDEGPGQQPPDLEERKAAMREALRSGWEQAEREAAAGDSRRLHALEDLVSRMKERVESRRREQSD
jgi:hypothetical protein